MKTKKSFLWLAFLILATIWILARRNQKVSLIPPVVLCLAQYTRLRINMTLI